LCGVVLRLLDCLNDVLIQPFMPDSSIVTLDVGTLAGFARLDMRTPPAWAAGMTFAF